MFYQRASAIAAIVARRRCRPTPSSIDEPQILEKPQSLQSLQMSTYFSTTSLSGSLLLIANTRIHFCLSQILVAIVARRRCRLIPSALDECKFLLTALAAYSKTIVNLSNITIIKPCTNANLFTIANLFNLFSLVHLCTIANLTILVRNSATIVDPTTFTDDNMFHHSTTSVVA